MSKHHHSLALYPLFWVSQVYLLLPLVPINSHIFFLLAYIIHTIHPSHSSSSLVLHSCLHHLPYSYYLITILTTLPPFLRVTCLSVPLNFSITYWFYLLLLIFILNLNPFQLLHKFNSISNTFLGHINYKGTLKTVNKLYCKNTKFEYHTNIQETLLFTFIKQH